MSDAARKDFSTKAEETLKPDSQKSAFEKASESVTGTADSVAASLQPGDSKSTTQKLSDETSSAGNTAADKSKSALGNAQETLSNLGNSASNTAGSVGQNVQETASNLAKSAEDNANAAAKNINANTGAQEGGKTYLEQAQEVVAGALNTVSAGLKNAADTVSGAAADASKGNK